MFYNELLNFKRLHVYVYLFYLFGYNTFYSIHLHVLEHVYKIMVMHMNCPKQHKHYCYQQNKLTF